MIDTDERLSVPAVMAELDSEPATQELKLALVCVTIELIEAYATIDGLKAEIAGLRSENAQLHEDLSWVRRLRAEGI